MNAITKVIEEVVDSLDERPAPLRECPFDDGPGAVIKEAGVRFPFHGECTKCKIRTPNYVSYELAAAHWNRRPKGKRARPSTSS